MWDTPIEKLEISRVDYVTSDGYGLVVRKNNRNKGFMNTFLGSWQWCRLWPLASHYVSLPHFPYKSNVYQYVSHKDVKRLSAIKFAESEKPRRAYAFQYIKTTMWASICGRKDYNPSSFSTTLSPSRQYASVGIHVQSTGAVTTMIPGILFPPAHHTMTDYTLSSHVFVLALFLPFMVCIYSVDKLSNLFNR